MQKTKKMIRGIFLLAGLATLTATASAFNADAQILIDRALNSPTITVRYSGVTATLVELRVNGVSLSTREVQAAKNSGETNFNLSASDLKEGDNEVEIRLFDRTGRLVGKDKTNISVAPGANGPIFVEAPKIGQTVMGPVEIKVGFSQDIKNSYVSFFVDGNFKSITNFPPFNYVWDTERETNGWHEIEAWAIDDTNTTNKTGKVRLFVNNPSGRTNRKGVDTTVTPTRNSLTGLNLVGSERGVRSTMVLGRGKVEKGVTVMGLPPVVTERLIAKSNPLHFQLAGAAGTRQMRIPSGIVSGPKLLVPTGRRTAKTTATQVGTVAAVATGSSVTSVAPTMSATIRLVPIVRGTRLPELGNFDILLDHQFVIFDVAPRVDSGIPMTPFRHLLEKAGGTVDWKNLEKRVLAKSDGRKISLKIGDKLAQIGAETLSMEKAPYLDHGRTIVPLSFMQNALKVNVEYDRATGHVLITSIKK